MTPSLRRTFGLAFALAVLWPSSASAHLASTGLGPFYDGLAHLFISPVDLMAVLAVAMLGGMNGARPGRWALTGVTLSWGIGGAIGLLVGAEAMPLALGAVAAPFVVGLAVALDRRLPLATTTCVAVLVGAGFGLLNGLGLGAAGAGYLPYAGILTGVFVCVTLMAAGTIHWTRNGGWQRVCVRVAASWITAISLLMIGWAARPG